MKTTPTDSFSIKGSFSHAWDLYWKRPELFLGVSVIGFVLQAILGLLEEATDRNFLGILVSLVAFVVTVLFSMGMWWFMHKAFENVQSATLKDLWYPSRFVPYLLTTILTTVIVFVGLLAFVVPGIVFALMFGFAGIIVLTQNKGPIEAMKESARITKGKRFRLFVFGLAVLGVNILGLLALVIGLLVTIPLSSLATMHVFHALVRRSVAQLEKREQGLETEEKGG